MDVRAATIADARKISRLIYLLCQPFLLSPDGKGAEPFFESISEEAIERCITAENFAYYVAEDREGIIGVAALRDNKHLYHLFISSRHQKKDWENSFGNMPNGEPWQWGIRALSQ